jgi:hypothetical protein
MEVSLLEPCFAMNQLIKRHGFSPNQHALGQDIRLPASVLAGSMELTFTVRPCRKAPFSACWRYARRHGWLGHGLMTAAVYVEP